MANYSLGKTCKTCGQRLLNKNQSGFCNHHRDRTGPNNPFFGRTHSAETVELLRKSNSVASREKWKDEEYRKKVIRGVSKPRRVGFKKEQSDRVKDWYRKNPEQRRLRSLTMGESWKDGKIIPNSQGSANRSKIENDLYNELSIRYPDVARDPVKIGGKWFLPDATLEQYGILIEFYGNYWHGNPTIYKPDDFIRKLKKTAKDVWEKDRIRIKALENMFPFVIIVWEDEYKADKDRILRKIDAFVNWESCAI